jgi:hypothetical protein
MFSMVFTPAENIPLFELLVGQRRKRAIVLGQLRLGGGRMTQQCAAIVDKPFFLARQQRQATPGFAPSQKDGAFNGLQRRARLKQAAGANRTTHRDSV